MMQYVFLLLLCLATYMEGTLTTLPIVLALLIPYAVFSKSEAIFFFMFLSGIFLDLMNGQTIGFSSLYFLCSVFILLLYQRKYEIASYPFIVIATSIVSFFYLLLFVHRYIIEQVVVSVVLAEIFFMLFRVIRASLRTK